MMVVRHSHRMLEKQSGITLDSVRTSTKMILRRWELIRGVRLRERREIQEQVLQRRYDIICSSLLHSQHHLNQLRTHLRDGAIQNRHMFLEVPILCILWIVIFTVIRHSVSLRYRKAVHMKLLKMPGIKPIMLRRVLIILRSVVGIY